MITSFFLSAFRKLIPANFAIVISVQRFQPSIGLIFVKSFHTFVCPYGKFFNRYPTITINVY